MVQKNRKNNFIITASLLAAATFTLSGCVIGVGYTGDYTYWDGNEWAVDHSCYTDSDGWVHHGGPNGPIDRDNRGHAFAQPPHAGGGGLFGGGHPGGIAGNGGHPGGGAPAGHPGGGIPPHGGPAPVHAGPAPVRPAPAPVRPAPAPGHHDQASLDIGIRNAVRALPSSTLHVFAKNGASSKVTLAAKPSGVQLTINGKNYTVGSLVAKGDAVSVHFYDGNKDAYQLNIGSGASTLVHADTGTELQVSQPDANALSGAASEALDAFQAG